MIYYWYEQLIEGTETEGTDGMDENGLKLEKMSNFFKF